MVSHHKVSFCYQILIWSGDCFRRERISMNHDRTQTDQTGLVSHHGFFNMAADAVAASTGFSCSCFHLAFSVKTCGLVQAPKILVIKWKVGSGWGYRHSVFVLVVVSPTMLLPKLCSYRHSSHTLCFLCLWALRPYLNNCWWNSYPPSYKTRSGRLYFQKLRHVTCPAKSASSTCRCSCNSFK